MPHTHLLDFVGVKEQYTLALVANEVERAGGAAPNDARALRPLQDLLQLREVPAVDLWTNNPHSKTQGLLLLNERILGKGKSPGTHF